MGIKSDTVVKSLVIALVFTVVIGSLESPISAEIVNTDIYNKASPVYDCFERNSEVKTKVIQLSSVMTPEGTVITEIKANLPLGGSLVIEEGTKVTAGDKPVKTLIIKALAKAPQSPVTQVVVGPIYLIEPKDTVFSKSVTIVLPFNPYEVPKRYRVFIAYYDESTRTWVPILPTKVDYNTLTATAKINHLGVISVVAFRVLHVVGTSHVTTLTKYITLTKTLTTYLTHTSVITTTSTYTITFPSTFIITLTSTKAPTTYVNITNTVTVTSYSVTTSTITIINTKYVYQASYIYIGLIAVIIAVVILVTMSLLVPRR